MLTRNKRVLGRFLLSTALAGGPLAALHAAEFADDFIVDPTRLSAGSFDDASDTWSIESGSNGLNLQTSSNDPDVPGSIYIIPRDVENSIGIDVTFNAESDHIGSSTVFLESRVFSDVESPVNDEGDYEMQITYDRYGDSTYEVFYCLFRRMENGDEQPVADFGTDFCNLLTSGDNADGVRRSIDISSDINADSITISFDEVSRTLSVPGDYFPATFAENRIQLWLNRGNLGSASATLHEIRNGADTIHLANSPTNFTRYRPLYELDGIQRTASHANGILTLTAQATELDDGSNRLSVQQPTDYLESRFALSTATTPGTNGRARAVLEMGAYNDLADGGVDGRTGNVDVYMEADVRANGEASLYACAERIDDANGDNRTGFYADGNRCKLMPVRPALGDFMRASIALDRENGSLTFRANEYAEVLQLDGPFFTHTDPNAQIVARPRDLATVVLDIDEVRTSPTALTASESDSGATVPTPFPPIQTEIAAADSSIRYPYTTNAALDFVDDFSEDTGQLSFDPSADRTDAGIAFVDDSLLIESVQIDPDNCCGDGRLRIMEATDLVAARVSLSSESQIPIENDAHAMIRIEGNWYNDTQDGGFDDRGGDVYAQLRIRVQGSGRREASFCFDRQTGDGSNDGLDIVDGENCGTFDRIPELDTEYDMSMALDRAAGTMTLTFADETRVVALGNPIYTAARNERAINVQHEGSSGRAVGRIHSLTTESSTIDMADNPLIGPYRPSYSTQYPGRDVTVVDGRLRITMDSALGDGNSPRFVSRNPSEYVSAVVEASSESRLDGGLVAIGVGGHMYNDIMDGGLGTNDAEGAVYAIINLIINDDGENYYEYCAFRSNSSDFSDATELLTGGETCPRFSAVPALDTPARVLVSIDRDRGVLIFGVDDEVIEYTITTGIFTPHDYFNGVRVRAEDGSRVVGYADDLTFTDDAIPLSMSSTRLGYVAADDTGEEPVDVGEPTGSGSSGGGGGGCSIASGSGGPGAPLLLALAMLMLRYRRYLGAHGMRRAAE